MFAYDVNMRLVGGSWCGDKNKAKMHLQNHQHIMFLLYLFIQKTLYIRLSICQQSPMINFSCWALDTDLQKM